jgi:hypothetical protein
VSEREARTSKARARPEGMPVAPAEVTAEISIETSTSSVDDLLRAARATDLAIDAGPGSTGLSGARAEVLSALGRLLEAAIDSGARSVRVDLQIPEVSDPD